MSPNIKKSFRIQFIYENLILSIIIPNPDKPVRAMRKSRFIGEPNKKYQSRNHDLPAAFLAGGKKFSIKKVQTGEIWRCSWKVSGVGRTKGHLRRLSTTSMRVANQKVVISSYD